MDSHRVIASFKIGSYIQDLYYVDIYKKWRSKIAVEDEYIANFVSTVLPT